MIKINLLPEEQKIKNSKSFDLVYLVYLAPVIIGILLLTHLYLGSIFFFKQKGLTALNKEWLGLESQRQKIINFKSESETKSQDAQIIDELTNKSIHWSEKLNRLSLDLPRGIWFNEITASLQSIEIKACVFSSESNGVDLINKFLSLLKDDRAFSNDFINIETGKMFIKKLGAYEVMDFTLSAAKTAAK